MRRDVFQAVADPNRRAILGLLAKQPLNLNQVAEHFSVSRPAISQHMKVLKECGLVIVNQKGRERVCEAKMEGLGEIWDWLFAYKQYWQERLNRLDEVLKDMQTKPDDYGK
jgi:DNA-binding transcriptional ArsR family regulator